MAKTAHFSLILQPLCEVASLEEKSMAKENGSQTRC